MIGAPHWIDFEIADSYGITRRQRDVLIGIAKGMTNAEIGRALFLSEDTVNTHTRGLFKNLKARNRTSAVAVAYDFGVLRTRAMRIELARAAGLQVAA